MNKVVSGSFPAEYVRTAHDVANGLEHFGDREALVAFDGTRLSYVDLAARGDAFAAQLGEERRLLAIEASNHVETVVALLGALRGGHVVQLIAPDASARNRQVLDTYRPDARFAQGRLTLDAPEGGLHPDLAILLSTSGTTGAVKLVRLSRDAINANAASIAEYLGLGERERAITSLPLHYSYGLSVLTSHLGSGGCLLLTDASVVEPAFWDFFDAEGGTSFAGVPHTYELIERAHILDRALPTLRTMTQAGGRMVPESVRSIAAAAAARGRRLFVMYGQTEATARMAYLPPELAEQHPGCIGRAIPGGSFSLIDPDGADIAGAGQSGELVYRGPNVMLGYALSREDLAKGREVDALHTGDLAERTPEGLFRIVGRKSRFVKPFGLRVGLDEIEAWLADRGVPAMATGTDDLIAIACRGPVPDGIAGDLAASLKVPVALFDVREVEAFPLLPSGKRDYQTVLAHAVAARGTASETDASVASIYAGAFPGATIAPTDSFASLGGDSLNYVTVSLALEDLIGELPDRWEEMPVAALAARSGGASRARFGWWRWRAIESEIVLRALAIIAVIVNHATDIVVGGGANVLLMLAGFSMARYQRDRFARGEGWQIIRAFALRVILPYYLLMVAVLASKRTLDVPSLLLVSNFTGRFGNILEPYWFLELLFQCMLIMAVLFLIPAVRSFSARDPWRFGLALLGVSLCVGGLSTTVFPHPGLANRTPDALFYLLALGWCLNLARNTSRKLFISAIVVALEAITVIPSVLDGVGGPHQTAIIATHVLWLVGGSMLILWMPRIRLLGALHAVVTTVAAASFYIYLGHGIPVHYLAFVRHNHSLVLNVGASVALGLALWWGIQLASAWLNAWSARRRGTVSPR